MVSIFLTELQLLGCLSLLLVPFLILLHSKTRQHHSSSSSSSSRPDSIILPPGPTGLPVIGNIHHLGELPHHDLRRMSDKYGPVMYLKLGSVPTVVVSSVDMAAEVLKNQDLSTCDRPPVVALRKFSYGGQDIATAIYDERWRQAKKIAMVELFTMKRVHSFKAVREEEVAILVGTLRRRASSLAATVNVGEMFICLFNNIICREVFGRRISAEGECGRSMHQDMIRGTIQLMGGFCAGDFFPSMEWLNVVTGVQKKLDDTFVAMDEFLEKEIQAHREEGDRDADFCDILLRLQKDPNTSPPITTTQIKGILMDMFLGGTETTASALEWGMAELVRCPAALAKAQEEVRRVAGKKGKVEEVDLQELRYLKLVIKEVFRLHPLALLPRGCRATGCKIGGYDIPMKTTIFVNSWALGRDPKYWPVRPEEFWPERFEESDVEFKGQHFQFIPFGSGRRMCPGMPLGIAGLELAFANLLYAFDWAMPDGKDDIDMTEQFGLTTHLKTNLVLKVAVAGDGEL